ncbi:MAG: glycosyltransferase family 39 protein [Magnetococcus sp. YQC-9]
MAAPRLHPLDPLWFIGMPGVVATFFALRTQPEAIQLDWLIRWDGLFLAICALLIGIGLLFSATTMRTQVRQLLPGRLILLIPTCILTASLLTALIAPQTHRLFYDETIYLNIGQNLAHLDRAQLCNAGGTEHGLFFCEQGEYNKQPNGYPFLISLVFRLFGVSETAIFLMNNLLLGLMAAGSLLLTLSLGASLRAGLCAAGVVMFNPIHLHWFNTTAAEPAASFTVALAIAAALLLRATPTPSGWLLTSATTAFALTFRPESLLLLPLIAFILWPKMREQPRAFLASLTLLLFLTLPHALHLDLFRRHPWGSSNEAFAIANLATNLTTNGLFYLDNRLFPLPFTLLALLGLFVSNARFAPRALLGVWFLLFWGVFLFFYAGSYQYGADVRFALLSALPLALLAGFGAEWCITRLTRLTTITTRRATLLMVALLGCATLPFLPYVRAETREAASARADVAFARQMARLVPKDAFILTHNPNLFQLWGLHAGQLSLISTNPDYVNLLLLARHPNAVYFHDNFWCHVSDPKQSGFCRKARELYDLEEIVRFQAENRSFGLYKIKLTKQ